MRFFNPSISGNSWGPPLSICMYKHCWFNALNTVDAVIYLVKEICSKFFGLSVVCLFSFMINQLPASCMTQLLTVKITLTNRIDN